jgi:murein DD-endopeptidase MepM/ murein hydrolase activator NlpD
VLAVVATSAVVLLTGGGATWAAPVAGAAPAAAGAPGRWTAPVWPLRVVRPFQPPPQPWLAGHRGLDLAATSGDDVRAVDDGVVVWAGELAGVGVVSVAHRDGLRSTYQPVDPVVGVGDAVLRGQLLGALTAGASHCAPSACLHLGARRSESYVDPALLLGLRAPRLLPYLAQTDSWFAGPMSSAGTGADTTAATTAGDLVAVLRLALGLLAPAAGVPPQETG